MFTHNPFAELSASIDPAVMQAYVIVMMVLVVAGTLYDVIHKGSARYFFDNWRSARRTRDRDGSAAERSYRSRSGRSAWEVLTSAEFCTARRRIAHLLTMYGFSRLRRHHRGHGLLLLGRRHPGAPPFFRRCGTSGP